MIFLAIGIFVSLVHQSWPAIRSLGTRFLTGRTWNPVSGQFGALPFVAGTLLTSVISLVLAIPFALSIALFLGEYFRTGPIAGLFKSLTELLAGIPSVIYGFWGLFVLVPWIRALELRIGAPPYGVGILTASLILTVMIIPYAASIARDVIDLVPQHLKEGAYALGATRFEVIRKVILPFARSGILAGIFLAFGRALGETMAVTMVIGNRNLLPKTLFDPGNTMASVIANEFTEAAGRLYLSALIEIGLLLFLITLVFHILGKWVIQRTQVPGES